MLALVSGFCAIGITFYQAYLQRTQQYASVVPILEIYHTNHAEDNRQGSAILITNVGLGPAFIDSVHYHYQHKRYVSMSKLLKAVLSTYPVTDSTLLTSDLWPGRVIPTGERLYLYQTSNRAVGRRLDQQHEFISSVVYYHSVYGESWTLDTSQQNQARNQKLK